MFNISNLKFDFDWDSDAPESLFDICVVFLIKNVNPVISNINSNGCLRLKDNVFLPSPIPDLIFSRAMNIGHPFTDENLCLFHSSAQLPLRQLNISYSKNIKEEQFTKFDKKNLIQITFPSVNLNPEAILNTLSTADELVSISYNHHSVVNFEDDLYFSTTLNKLLYKLPKLCQLSINSQLANCIIYSNTPNLSYLDLTNACIKQTQLEDLHLLLNLKYLSLHNVLLDDLEISFKYIGKIKSLRSLDLGQSSEYVHIKSYPGEVDDLMKYLITNLINLDYLELTGTNLAGKLTIEKKTHKFFHKEVKVPCGIAWLEENRSLYYLGLLNCLDDPAARPNIPAKHISGDANIAQLLVSVEYYINRPGILVDALNSLFELLKFHNTLTLADQMNSLEVIMNAMNAHRDNKNIQISGSAALFYIVKGDLKHRFTYQIKKNLANLLIDTMKLHLSDITMLRNGCLTFCHFKLPQDVMFCYPDLITLLLLILKSTLLNNDNFIQRITIYILNSLACQVDSLEKQVVGTLGAFKVMILIINERLQNIICDEVMEVAWSMMWNATDETALNCKLFIQNDGLETFKKCLKVFPSHEELLRNMMGLLGNVAEVESLRIYLMSNELITIFNDLLESTSDGIEVSYNACGVLANIVSDGDKYWTVDIISRSEVMQNMTRAIQRWPLDIQRNINYRSFKPIVKLLHFNDSPAVQYWATWALCNLTTVYDSKYCPILLAEGGDAILSEMACSALISDDVKTLANNILKRCDNYKNSCKEDNADDVMLVADENDEEADSDFD